MTALRDILHSQIAATGPITVADFMETCLLHPVHGYYTTHTVFGAGGDFVTAPEITPMFGEMLSLSLADAWVRQGKPQNAIIAELGPGRGVLMQAFLRAAEVVDGFAQLPLNMVEASPQLRDMQAQLHPDVTHHANVQSLPDAPIFLVANEFFDALPIRQFQRGETGWHERMVGASDGALTMGLGPDTAFDVLAHRMDDTKPGDIVEYCPALPVVLGDIAGRIRDNGGAALFIDYGDWRSQGDTLQAVAGHTQVPPLHAPGQTDLTAHVDFEAIYNAATTTTVSRLVTQGVFLERLGITARAQALAKNLAGDALENHIAAHRRLLHPDEMGGVFKAIGLGPAPDMLPAGVTT